MERLHTFLIWSLALICFVSCRTPNRPATQTQSGPQPAKADFLSIEGNSSIAANQCERYDVVLRAALTEVPALKDYPLGLSTTEGSLFSDAACTNSTSIGNLSEGLSRTSFYFRSDRGGQLMLTARSDGSQIASAALGVTVLARATLSFTQAILDFGPLGIGDHAVLSIAVRNTGLGSARSLNQGLPAVSTPFAFPGGVFPGTGGTCTSVLESGSECTVVLSFSPDTASQFSSSLRVSFLDDYEGGEALLTLMGEGLDARGEELLADDPDVMLFSLDEVDDSPGLRTLDDGRSLMTTVIHDGESHHLTLAMFDLNGEKDFSFGTRGVLQVIIPGNLSDFSRAAWLPGNRVWLMKSTSPASSDE